MKQELDSIHREYFRRFKSNVPAWAMRALSSDELEAKMQSALDAGEPVKEWSQPPQRGSDLLDKPDF